MAKAATETTLPIGQPTLTERSLEDRTYFASNVDKDKDKDKDNDKDKDKNKKQYTLTVNVSPSGGGSVTKNPSGPIYVEGTTVTLTAGASSGYTFTGWSGDASGSSNTIPITMDRNKTVTANFKHQYTLTVNVSPSGGGSVTQNPNPPYYAGQTVTLTAQANPGYAFSNWSGDASGSSNTIPITMDRNKTVTANFKHQYTLTVNVLPSGGGSVTQNPNPPYYAGQTVTLTAQANPGYAFDNWTGDAHGSGNPVTITMNGNETVTANFKNKKQYTLTVHIAPPGGGSVTKSPDQPGYAHGDEVYLTETENPGYCFSRWTGGASGSNNPVKIKIDRDTTVTAHFKKKKCKKHPHDCDD